MQCNNGQLKQSTKNKIQLAQMRNFWTIKGCTIPGHSNDQDIRRELGINHYNIKQKKTRSWVNILETMIMPRFTDSAVKPMDQKTR